MVKTTRPYNFGAGPAALPESILYEAQAELLNWNDSGMSILEIGHRTPAFQALMQEAETDLRTLLDIPDTYHVLFLGAPARGQFSMIPMNLLMPHQQAAHVISGVWSGLAYEEACKVASAYCLAGGDSLNFHETPSLAHALIRKNTGYVYYTPNETINGVRFADTPHFGEVPLVADMTSCLLSEPIKVTDYGLIFAGAQKNIANAGLTLVIIRADLLTNNRLKSLPTLLDYRVHAHHHSLYATPPVFNCYLAAKMFRWIKAQGGVRALYALNCQKTAKLYDYIDSSAFYQCDVAPASRSLMNVCFSLAKPTLSDQFLACAAARGLYALQGHRLVGGLRASLYNAMPLAGVEALIAFMDDFSKAPHS